MQETSLTLRAVLNSSMSISLSSPAMLSNCLVTQSSQRASASTLMVSGSAEDEDDEKMKEVEEKKKEARENEDEIKINQPPSEEQWAGPQLSE